MVGVAGLPVILTVGMVQVRVFTLHTGLGGCGNGRQCSRDWGVLVNVKDVHTLRMSAFMTAESESPSSPTLGCADRTECGMNDCKKDAVVGFT